MIFEVLSGHDILKGKLIQFPAHRCRKGSGEGAKSVRHVASSVKRLPARARRLVRPCLLIGSHWSATDAERALKAYVSSLKHLEDHERKIRMEDIAKKRETKSLNRTDALPRELLPVKKRSQGRGVRRAAGPYGKGPLAVRGPLARRVVAGHPAPGDGWFGRTQSRRPQ